MHHINQLAASGEAVVSFHAVAKLAIATGHYIFKPLEMYCSVTIMTSCCG